jgi:hypothetical protein
MRGVIRILAVYANVLLAVLMFGDFWTGFRWSHGWSNFNPFSAVPLLAAVPPLLALSTLRWPPIGK